MNWVVKILLNLILVVVYSAHSKQKVVLSKECEIPQWARIIHIPQIHYTVIVGALAGEYSRFMKQHITHTQFLINQFIRQYPNGIYLEESQTSMRNEKTRAIWLESNNPDFLKNLLEDFSIHKDYEQLDEGEQYALLRLGGLAIAFLSGDIDVVYPSSSVEEQKLTQVKFYHYLKSVVQLYRSPSQMQQMTPSERMSLQKEREEINSNSNEFIFDEREGQLKRHVMELFKPKDSQQKIFFTYGMGHDFSDEFSDEYFYQVPLSCVISRGYLLTEKTQTVLEDIMQLIVLKSKTSESSPYSLRFGVEKEKPPLEEILQLRKRACHENYELLNDYVQNENAQNSKVFNKNFEQYYSTEELKIVLDSANEVCKLTQPESF